jgi:type VI protein secretion system component VasK
MSVYRDRIIVAVLIVGVCCFSLLPAAYLVFRAWQWQRALAIIELIFFPLFVVFASAAWLAYRRHQARRLQWHDDEAPEPPGDDEAQF